MPNYYPFDNYNQPTQPGFAAGVGGFLGGLNSGTQFQQNRYWNQAAMEDRQRTMSDHDLFMQDWRNQNGYGNQPSFGPNGTSAPVGQDPTFGVAAKGNMTQAMGGVGSSPFQPGNATQAGFGGVSQAAPGMAMPPGYSAGPIGTSPAGPAAALRSGTGGFLGAVGRAGGAALSRFRHGGIPSAPKHSH